MTDRQVQFKARIQDFLAFHFPSDEHTFKDYCGDFYVTVGEEKNSKLIFNVVGTSIYRLSINKEHYDEIAPIFGLDNIDRSQFEMLNDFLLQVNNHASFKTLFETIEPIDFSKILVSNIHEDYSDHEVEDSITFTIQSKFIKTLFTCGIQFDWHFEDNGDNTKLKGIMALCLSSKQPVRFAVGFDVETKSANLVTTDSNSYNEFFEKNAALQLETQLDTYLHDFLVMLIEKQNKEAFDGKAMELNDLVKLLNMASI